MLYKKLVLKNYVILIGNFSRFNLISREIYLSNPNVTRILLIIFANTALPKEPTENVLIIFRKVQILIIKKTSRGKENDHI